jgi:pimeloyl-ACP methyl ester carboxylesterase
MTSLQPGDAGTPIESKHSVTAGHALHYLSAGSGDALVLLHGFTETAEAWRPAITRLASRFRTIAPDLPGIGESGIPEQGYDMVTAAARIHQLVVSLGVTRVRLVGHDIGLMVAYAYAATYPSEVDRLVLMDAFLPGVGAWESYVYHAKRWHFFFNGPTPEALVEGRERIYFEHFWNDFAANPQHSLSETDRRRYAAAYARPGRMAAAWRYFAAIPETARAFSELAQRKLELPVLVLAGEKAAGAGLVQQVELVATHVSSRVLPNTGHWLLEERQDETLAALDEFL